MRSKLAYGNVDAMDAARWPAEASGLLACRLLLGDEQTAELVFEQEYDAGFARRHSNQLAGLMDSYLNTVNASSDE